MLEDDDEVIGEFAKLIFDRTQLVQADAEDLAYELLQMMKDHLREED